MSRISRNIAIIVRSEKLIARRQMSVIGRQAGFIGAAAILAGLGLIMLDVAAYLALSGPLSPPVAALIVAVVNLALAAGLIALASGMNADRDVRDVCEVRDMAIADLEGEVRDAAGDVRDIAESLRKMARDPLGGIGASAIGSIIAMLLKNLRK